MTSHKWFFSIAVMVVVAIGAGLRVSAALETVVDSPIRADARVYFANAYNFRMYGTLSDSLRDFGQEAPVTPSAKVPPGYPLFLALFIDGAPDKEMIDSVVLAQALLGTLVVLLSMLLARRLIGVWPAVVVGLLVATSPHLVNYGNYLLTETLFSLLFLAGIYASCLLGDSSVAIRRFLVLALLAGASLGLAALTRSALYAFVIPLAALVWVSLERRRALVASFAVLVGFVTVLSPWFIRNLMNVEDESGSVVLNASLQHGMYPGFMYEGKPESFGYPYRFDERTEQFHQSTSLVLQEIARRFREEPLRHLWWYAVGKPITLWQWGSIQGAGEIAVYPLVQSPYAHPGLHHLTYLVSKVLHWPMVLLAMMMTLLLFLPRRMKELDRDFDVFGLRCVALAPIYFTALLMVLAPFPRYSVPLRPELYILGVAGALFLWRLWNQARKYTEEEVTSGTSE